MLKALVLKRDGQVMDVPWKQRAQRATRPDHNFLFIAGPPTPPASIRAAEHSLGVQFPTDLRAALLECNGVGETLTAAGMQTTILFPMIYPLERLVAENHAFRQREDLHHAQHLPPPETLLLFTDILTGD